MKIFCEIREVERIGKNRYNMGHKDSKAHGTYGIPEQEVKRMVMEKRKKDSREGKKMFLMVLPFLLLNFLFC